MGKESKINYSIKDLKMLILTKVPDICLFRRSI